MNFHGKTMMKITGILLLGGLLLWQCSGNKAAELEGADPRGKPVSLEVIQSRSFTEMLEVTGTVKARQQVRIVAEESGKVAKIYKNKGAFVQQNDTLALLENELLAAGYQQARAALHQAQLDFRSKQVLFQQKALSENEYLASRYALEQAQAAFRLARARYQKLTIRAPFSGYLAERFQDRGAYVLPGSPLYDIIDAQSLIVQAHIAERYFGQIREGTPIQVSFDAAPELTISSKVRFIANRIDPATRTFLIEADLPNPNWRLAPDMVANVQVQLHLYPQSIVIPLSAIMQTEQGWYVFVEEGGKAVQKPVSILSVQKQVARVKGLQEGDRLVVLGQHFLASGDVLNPVANPAVQVIGGAPTRPLLGE